MFDMWSIYEYCVWVAFMNITGLLNKMRVCNKMVLMYVMLVKQTE
jgi:hypothetical protein